MKKLNSGLLALAMMLTLLSSTTHAGTRGAETYRMMGEADAAYQAQQWDRARGLYIELSQRNPDAGHYSWRLGQSLAKMEKFEASSDALENCVRVGFLLGHALIEIAANSARLDQADKAMTYLNRALAVQSGLPNLEKRLAGPEWASLADHPDFIRLRPPVVPEDVGRIAGWRLDLEYMVDRLEALHYDLYHAVSPAEWQAAKNELFRRLPEWDDAQIIGEAMALVAMLQDGHTVVIPPFGGERAFHQLPVMLSRFEDGLFLRAAPSQYGKAVGGRVVRIGDYGIDEAVARLARVVSHDNKQIRALLSQELYMLIPELLHAVGIVDKMDKVELEVELPSGKKRTIKLVAEPLSPAIFQRLVADEGWITARDKAQAEDPLWLKRARDFPQDFSWFEYLPTHNTVYFQFNVVRAKPNETLAELSASLHSLITEKRAEALIIDIRHNSGGNNSLLQPLLDDLIRSGLSTDPEKLFVIIGNRTYSAAMNFATRLERYTDATFVGQPTGSLPNMIGDNNYFTLPYSGLMVSYSNRLWQDSVSWDYRKWIAPDVLVEMSSADFAQNKDPVVETILEIIQESTDQP